MIAIFRNTDSMKAYALACAAACLLASCATAPPERAVLRRLGVAPDAAAALPSFLGGP